MPSVEHRVINRRRVLKTAHIVISEKTPKLECVARDVSDSGARLKVSTTLGIPANFDVIIDGKRRSCQTVWKTDTTIGVSFV